MTTVLDVLEQLEATGSRNEKEEILENNASMTLLKDVFVAAGDPYLDYGVKKFKKPAPLGSSVADYEGVTDDAIIRDFIDLLVNYLATRKLTGNRARDAVISNFAAMDARQQKWCERLILKNLRCGVKDTTVNKVWTGAIKKFQVMLAGKLDCDHAKQLGIQIRESIKYPVQVEPKLDGLRCVAFKENGKVTMFTRNGNPLETLPRVKEALEKAPIDNVVLDGEGMALDWNESASVMMSHKHMKDDAGLVYNVFDVIPLDEWRAQNSTVSFKDRVVALDKIVTKVNSDNVKRVKGRICYNDDDVLAFYQECLDAGYEGVMIKDLNATYIFDRSDAIMKMKPITTYEGVIVGSYEGRHNTRHEGKFGGFEVLLPNGVITRVGGGFNDKDRAAVQLEGAEAFVGRIVECEAQPDPATKDGLTVEGRMRFPVFTRYRDARDVDPKVMQAFEKFKGEK